MSNPIANAVYKTSLWAKLRRYILVVMPLALLPSPHTC